MPPEPEFWVDSQISPVIAKWLKEKKGFATKSSYSLQLTGVADMDIFKLAKKQGNVIIISKDTDFVNLIQTLGSPPKLINVVMGNCTSSDLWKALDVHLDEMIQLFAEDGVDIIELR
jgi:predicted nuclease of predicted toxin-antitoxin system